MPLGINGRDQYPAPGFLHYYSGALYYVGNSGFCWSSAMSGAYGVYLDFHVAGFNSGSAHSRGHGFPLRCLSE
ncbi:hypothetical protein [uncultured Rikenella sp.]|uniref:hypothetical protein n=1 Tax=uncultured Rikenella sp. TaxID=368003 RepID=UPI0025DA667F|nr:hypothetical protein [uncultured Rikenella sp.]